MKKILCLTTTLLLCLGASHAQKRTTAQEYISQYKALAVIEQEIYGIPASITMAQGILESDCGNSRLATLANNHFGIKCKKEWTGAKIYHDDDAKGECFRRYKTAEQSYRDHSEFLDKSPRYQSLFQLDILDYKGWARGLKACGYATNPKYADILIRIIEEHSLYILDTEGELIAEAVQHEKLPSDNKLTSAESEDSQQGYTPEKVDVDNFAVSLSGVGGYTVYINNGSEFVVASKGDTYRSIGKKVKVSERKLRKFNDVGESAEPREGEAVYIRIKAKRSLNGKLMHSVKEGETLHSISQKYGIRLSKIARLNRLKAESPIHAGQQIRLM